MVGIETILFVIVTIAASAFGAFAYFHTQRAASPAELWKIHDNPLF